MNYYALHIGDYASHTAHLSCLEDLAYRRLLDLYYTTERPLPASVTECARKIRMREHELDVRGVLEEFFTLSEDGWVNRRCEREISKVNAAAEKKRAGANKRWGKSIAQAEHEQCMSNENMESEQCKGSAQAMHMHNAGIAQAYHEQCMSNAYEMLPNTHNPIPMTQDNPPIVPPPGGSVGLPEPLAGPENPGAPPQKQKNKSTSREKFCDVDKPDDVEQQVWDDWLRHRRTKKARVSVTVMADFRREAARAVVSLQDALRISQRRGWTGFEAEWLLDSGRQRAPPKKRLFDDTPHIAPEETRSGVYGGEEDGFQGDCSVETKAFDFESEDNDGEN